MPDKIVTVTKAGVVQLPWGDEQFAVNSDMIMSDLKEKICALNPKYDCNGNFAGRVTIIVELLGDLEHDDNGGKE